MYLRKSKKPNGRTYLTIVQGYRDEDGKNKARTVRSLGYVDALEAEFDDPVAHFEEECRRMTEEAARAQAPVTVEFSAARRIGKRAEGRVEPRRGGAVRLPPPRPRDLVVLRAQAHGARVLLRPLQDPGAARVGPHSAPLLQARRLGGQGRFPASAASRPTTSTAA